MPNSPSIRASFAESSQVKLAPQIATGNSDFAEIARHMYNLMMRNVATTGYVFIHPTSNGYVNSLPGCIIAAPSFPATTVGINQDYVYNWTRDAAITAFEIIAAYQSYTDSQTVQNLVDYVNFAATCQTNAKPSLDHACYTIDGQSRPWNEQTDGPALQSLAVLQAYPLLDASTQALAKQVISKNIDFLLNAYTNKTTNLWEEVHGYSFFARAAQLRCFRAIKTNSIGLNVPAAINTAITWLETALSQHWNGHHYVSVLQPDHGMDFYDPNIDIVSAALYGAASRTDTKLLATAAQLRSQWADDNSPEQYSINRADRNIGLGPLLGRYPGDFYNGDTNTHILGKHPWALCTCNLAELYYGIAHDLKNNLISLANIYDPLSQPFFNQLGISQNTSETDAATALRNAGDAMLQAVIYHSDHLELSEQFDGESGYEKSVKNLTWSYAAFLSAVRTRNS